jgi:nicotinamidase-related amidase
MFRGGFLWQRTLLHTQAVLVRTMIPTIILVSTPVVSSASAQTKETVVNEWATLKAPPPPELKPVTVDPGVTALLILAIPNQNCNPKIRPRCVASVPKIQGLLTKARAKGMPVIYSLTRKASVTDIRKEVASRAEKPVVKASVDKFFGTELEGILEEKGIKTVILVSTSAHGAVLHTATGAAMRGLQVIVPVDGMSAGDTYAEQYTAWHLVNGPGTRRRTTLTRISFIQF